MGNPVLIGDILHRIKRPIDIEPTSRYKLVTVKLYHKGVVLREEKLGADIKSKMYQVKEGDFILSGIDARNGAFGIVPSELDGAIVTNDFWYFEIDDEVVDKSFFLELTATRWFDEICRKGSDGTTQRIRLQKGKFFNQTIYLPEIGEQREFNKRFQSLKKDNGALSSELTHQQTLLKKLRQQILQEAIEGKLTADWRAQNPDVEPASELLKRIAVEKAQLVKDKKIKAQKPLPSITDEEKPFDLPQGWEWCRLGDVGISATGGTPKTSESHLFIGSIPFIGPGHISPGGRLLTTEKYLSEEGSLHSTVADAGDVLMVCIGGSIGKTLIVSNRLTFNQQINSMRPLFISHKYLNYMMSASVFQKKLISKSTGTATPIINRSKWDTLLVALPPSAEQQAIVTRVEKLLALCDQLETQITQNQTHAEQLMQAVLKEAFSHNSAAEPAAPAPKAVAHLSAGVHGA